MGNITSWRRVVQLGSAHAPPCTARPRSRYLPLGAIGHSRSWRLPTQARAHAHGAAGFPAISDVAALHSLVVKFGLAKQVHTAFAALPVPQKVLVGRAAGDGIDAMIDFGVTAAAHVLNLCFLVATNVQVYGVSRLVNEAQSLRNAPPGRPSLSASRLVLP